MAALSAFRLSPSTKMLHGLSPSHPASSLAAAPGLAPVQPLPLQPLPYLLRHQVQLSFPALICQDKLLSLADPGPDEAGADGAPVGLVPVAAVADGSGRESGKRGGVKGGGWRWAGKAGEVDEKGAGVGGGR